LAVGGAKCKFEERMAISGQITRRLKPEEEEILRKREELTAARAALAERELELVDLRSGLAAFEGRYLRQVSISRTLVRYSSSLLRSAGPS
jgi:hypothetical protein